MKISANRRYLTRDDGTPFLIHADTAWQMLFRLTPEQQTRYLDDRRAKGFNALHLLAITYLPTPRPVTVGIEFGTACWLNSRTGEQRHAESSPEQTPPSSGPEDNWILLLETP